MPSRHSNTFEQSVHLVELHIVHYNVQCCEWLHPHKVVECVERAEVVNPVEKLVRRVRALNEVTGARREALLV